MVPIRRIGDFAWSGEVRGMSSNIEAMKKLAFAVAVGASTYTFRQTCSECANDKTNIANGKLGFLWGRGKKIEELNSSSFGNGKLKLLSFGEKHSAAICDKGRLWFWTGNFENPKLVEANSRFDGIAVGKSKSFALTSDGKILEFNNNNTSKLAEVKVVDGRNSEKVVQISAFDDNFACVTSTGKAFSMGLGIFGQLGNGKFEDSNILTKILLPSEEKVSQVAVGKSHTAILTMSGKIFVCGLDSALQLGRKDSVLSWVRSDEQASSLMSAVPAPIDLPVDLLGKKFVSVSAGSNFTAAIVVLGDGRGEQGLVTFGEGLEGQLGHKNARHVGKVRLVEGLVGKAEWDEAAGRAVSLHVVEAACGAGHVVALLSNGCTLSWGANRAMQLGDGRRAAAKAPGLVMALQGERVRGVFAGADQSAALL